MRFKIDNAYLKDSMVLGAKLEGEGPISKYIDYIGEFKDSSFENSEIDMLTQSIDMLKERLDLKDSDIDLAIGGELSNQLTTTSYTLRKSLISLIGIYSACSTISLGLGLAGLLLNRDDINNILVFTSSHNQSAERQFRNPVEYGAPKKKTATFTATGSASLILTHEKTDIKVESSTIGKVIDLGQKDVNHMGAVMAPAAADTIYRHLRDLKREPDYYDLILTGDLGLYGKSILQNYINKRYNIVLGKNYNDCGTMLYNLDTQPVFAGGSGPVCSALVIFSYILKQMKSGKLKRVLIVPTGAIFSPTWTFQKETIPAIAHAVSLEVV